MGSSKPRNKRKKRNSTDCPRAQNNERQVRRKYRKHLIANCTKLRENDILTDCEIKVMDKPVNCVFKSGISWHICLGYPSSPVDLGGGFALFSIFVTVWDARSADWGNCYERCLLRNSETTRCLFLRTGNDKLHGTFLSPLSSTFSIILPPISLTFERTNRLKPSFVKRAETLFISASEFDKKRNKFRISQSRLKTRKRSWKRRTVTNSICSRTIANSEWATSFQLCSKSLFCLKVPLGGDRRPQLLRPASTGGLSSARIFKRKDSRLRVEKLWTSRAERRVCRTAPQCCHKVLGGRASCGEARRAGLQGGCEMD